MSVTIAAATLTLASPRNATASPSKSAQSRTAVREAVDALPPLAAIERLAKEGYRLKDPALLLDSAERSLARSLDAPDVEALARARTLNLVALDMLFYLQSPRLKSTWAPFEAEELSMQLARAQNLLGRLEARVEEIRAQQAAARLAAKTPPPRTGKGRISSGAVMITVGISGAALGLTGALLGRQAQKKIDDPSIYGATWDDWDTKGRNANLMSFAGAGAAVLGLAVGIPLLVSGTRAKRRASGSESAAASLRVVPQPRGLSLMGRF